MGLAVQLPSLTAFRKIDDRYMKAGVYVTSGCGDYWVSYAGSESAFFQLADSTYGGKRATSTINRAALSDLNNPGRRGFS